ncbi:TerC family protein [Microcella sp.]|uniref:TerC family protein n=1 Tax=Microcella sp. TaxID=1913979 RepID=UPI00299F797C|nr:TerC family protein [Microcella sp.]MDX2025469.1 TerC family protein [Microcella sp.]
MEFVFSPELLVAFATLLVLEIILGIDNVIFISILASKLPPEQQNRARIVGLSLAMIMRILLLFAASWIISLTNDLFVLAGMGFSGRDLILILGGLFLVYKAVVEIHEKLEGAEGHQQVTGKSVTFAGIIVQILLIDIVFSLDSVITAVGMVDELWIMIAAVVIAITLMLFTAKAISDFVNRHPTVKMLALAFLVLIGTTLIAEGFDVHVDKAFIYGPIAFAIIVEVLNLVYRGRQAKRRNETIAPVELRPTLVKDEAPADVTPVHLGGARRATVDPQNHPDGTP